MALETTKPLPHKIDDVTALIRIECVDTTLF
jgi:hypothetical protein